jgi:methylglyoxal/glyoxal reductase
MPFFSYSKKPQFSSKKLKELRLESWIALEKLYVDGKCKCIGVSNYMPKHLEEIIETKMSMPIINQCEFHPFYTNRTVFDACKQIGFQFQVNI